MPLFQTKERTLSPGQKVSGGSSRPFPASLLIIRPQPFPGQRVSLESQAHKDLFSKVYSFSHALQCSFLKRPHQMWKLIWQSQGDKCLSPPTSVAGSRAPPNDQGQLSGWDLRPPGPAKQLSCSYLNKLQVRKGAHWVVRDVHLQEWGIELIIAAPQRWCDGVDSVTSTERVWMIQATWARRWLVFTWKRIKKPTSYLLSEVDITNKGSFLFSKE